MKTEEFNENYMIDRKSKGVKALPKSGIAGLPPIRTADTEYYDPNETYYFFDTQTAQLRQTTGLRRTGEHLCTFGLKVIAIEKIHANRDDALCAGQDFFRSEIARLERRIEKFEAEKTGIRRPLKEYSIVNPVYG